MTAASALRTGLRYAAADLKLDGERVTFELTAPKATTPVIGALDAFLPLAKRSDRSIADFVARFGPLGMCSKHDEPHALPGSVGTDPGCHMLRPGLTGRTSENTAAYRDLAAKLGDLARLTLAVKARARRSRLVEAPAFEGFDQTGPGDHDASTGADWLRFRTWMPTILVTQMENLGDGAVGRGDEQTVVAQILENLLVSSGVGVTCRWDHQRPVVGVTSRSLFGDIAYDLISRMSGERTLCVCANCGQPFIPRVSRADVKYCRACGPRVDHRNQERARRARRRAEEAEQHG